ncbi:MAG TPA: cupin domain-containing protein [Pseudonocardiaceae bacterium]
MTTTDSALDRLYRDFADASLLPLWTQREDLMPATPRPAARAHVWRWDELYPLAGRAGDLVPVGRGGERRAIALANPGLHGEPYATPTLWAAIQYLGPREVAPAHRHSQGAFRFVVEGQGVWTVVNGDPVAMRRGDLLLTPSWAFHEHHNPTDKPMAWLDGLDIPLVAGLDAGFFEYGADTVSDTSTPELSRGERLWAHPGLRPLATVDETPRNSPLPAFRWQHTDAALAAQVELAAEGHPGAAGPGHAGIRFTNPATGGDALPSLRTEMHRLVAGAGTPVTRTVGSAVWQVFSGDGVAHLGDRRIDVATGDLVAVPSWQPLSFQAHTDLDLFTFSDAPVYQALNLARTRIG